jgi:hypothetical protein
MAYWQWKSYRLSRYVAVYVKTKGVAKPLPRSLVKHLDSASDGDIEKWVAEFADPLGQKYIRHGQDYIAPELADLVGKFCQFQLAEGRTKTTVQQHRSLLTRFALPFFCDQIPPQFNPEDWHLTSIKLQPWLEERGVTSPVRKRVNISLRTYYKYLYDEGIVKYHPQLRLRNPRRIDTPTPLRVSLTPEDIISFVSKCQIKELRLIALIGFGFSVRPQEIAALRSMDFRAGSSALVLECCKSLANCGLFNRLAVIIHRQRIRNEFRSPKSGSTGVVGCIDERIARLLVDELHGLGSDSQLFKHQLDWYYELWRRHGIQNVTMKDLRRASILWLGHHTKIEFVVLKSHARHKDPATTALYVRRPEEQLQAWSGLSLEL